jgi:cyclophilin family peptidyl-prolyl cis-trans isomerase/HEAT repeat protein
MRNKLFAFFSCVVFLFTACVPPEKGGVRSNDEVEIDLKDHQQRKVIEMADQRRVDSLVYYLRDQSGVIRYIALMGLGSMKDSLAIPQVAELLKDPVKKVRLAAVATLGQSGAERAQSFLLAAYDRGDSLSINQDFNGAILEAIGRCGNKAQLVHLATVRTFKPTDTLLLTGQCAGVYRFATRGITATEGTATMAQYVGNMRIPAPARLMAAHYLARARDIALDSTQVRAVIDGFWSSTDPNIKMSLAKAIGKSKAPAAFSFLAKAITTETDYRVKCNLVQSFAGHEPDTVLSILSPLFYDTNLHVARTAAEFFIKNGNARQGDRYWRYAKEENQPWPVRVALFQASNKWLSPAYTESLNYVTYRLREWFNRSGNIYEQAACLQALAEQGWQFRWIKEKGFSHQNVVVKTAATEALKSICQRENFFAYFGGGSTVVRAELNIYLMEALATNDPGMVANAAEALSTKALQFPALADSAHTALVYSVLPKLKFPRDVETYRVVQKMVDHYQGKPESPERKPDFSHPINWALFSGLTENSRAKITTSQGEIELEMLPEQAPGSVASFISLANEGFYDKKVFHRVVPNFVVQGGCPRGDGYGALDFCLRTEIGSARYDQAGWVGMASAGTDTEGTQFFITHSPTPHLDGNYTIFARVTSGMDVVHKLQVGDQIISIVVKG